MVYNIILFFIIYWKLLELVDFRCFLKNSNCDVVNVELFIFINYFIMDLFVIIFCYIFIIYMIIMFYIF